MLQGPSRPERYKKILGVVTNNLPILKFRICQLQKNRQAKKKFSTFSELPTLPLLPFDRNWFKLGLYNVSFESQYSVGTSFQFFFFFLGTHDFYLGQQILMISYFLVRNSRTFHFITAKISKKKEKKFSTLISDRILMEFQVCKCINPEMTPQVFRRFPNSSVLKVFYKSFEH